MRIIVCIKQVPVIARLEFDAASRTLRRDGVPAEVSAFDVRAIVKAVEMREQWGGEVIALTMGPPAAAEALDHALALGADRALHLCDPAFAGADTLATARTLARAVERERPDLVLLGRHSVDAETAQVGPQLAELLGLPQITVARTLTLDASGSAIEAERETDAGFETVRCRLPAVVTVAEDIAPERFPRKADREAARDKPRATLSAADLGGSTGEFGASGSPTWVAELRPVETHRRAEIVEAPDPTQAAAALASLLVERHGLFSTWNVPTPAELASGSGPVERAGGREFWAIVEHDGRTATSASLEIIGKLRALADRCDGTVAAVLLSDTDSATHTELAACGADRILASPLANAQERIGVATAMLAQAIDVHRPGAIVFPATTFGRDVAPRLAARLGLGLTSDCIDLDLDDEGRLEQFKPAFGGTVVAPILSRTTPEMATLRPGVLPAPRRDSARPVIVEALPQPSSPDPAVEVECISRRADGNDAAGLDHAEIVVGVGMGIGGPEGLARLQPLVEVLGAQWCATRDVTDAGWMPRQFQVGLTGRSIGPRLYIGLGIRGAFEHMVGLRRAGIVVVVNKNPKAMAFKQADYGIVGTWEEIVPGLIEALRVAKQGA